MTLQLRERTFEKVGGLKDHIQTLKEMIIYPLLYKELFEAHGIDGPRGVLFHGPPGTGKTLVAGAVAAECSRSTNRKMSFYVRKGADCLNKYFGESEKQLQDLFTQAQNTRPSIIFFDEIDGLVPTRSESQEHHASVVSTLLALMDGLDSKSEVFVIGATNRIDMIDPALRRPGRFDRELYFPLPPLESRFQIFQIHTKNWRSKPDSEFLLRLASECAGFCGADIQSLCSQAVMESFRRNYPQATRTTRKLNINFKNVQVTAEDFLNAKEKILPASQRLFTAPSRPLTPELEPLLKRSLDQCLEFIEKSCPFKFIHRNNTEFTKNKSITCPRVLLVRKGDQGHIPFIVSAILHNFDHLPVTVIDLPTINDQNVRSSDSGSLVQKIKQARQCMPGIIFFPDIGSWWELIDETGRMVLVSSLEKLDSTINSQLFLIASSNTLEYEDLPPEVRKLFPKNRAFSVPGPLEEEKCDFFSQLFKKAMQSDEATKFEPEINAKQDSDVEWVQTKKVRRNRRPKGQAVENADLTIEGKNKLGSYYRKYVEEKPDDKCVGVKNASLTQSSDSLNSNSKRVMDLAPWDLEPDKRPKLETYESTSQEDNPCSSSFECQPKMDELTKLCVHITMNASTESIIKLYEQVEIVLLRLSSTWDQIHLFQEIEREINVFSAS